MKYGARCSTRVCCSLLTLILLSPVAKTQTSCAIENPAVGVFICSPQPSGSDSDSAIPDVFHLSAQGNASDGQLISRFRILIDNRQILDNRLAIPLQHLSIEMNLKSPFDSGSHTLMLLVAGVGSAEVKGLRIQPSKSSFCDPFSRFDPRTCSISNTTARLHWSLPDARPQDPFDDYLSYVKLYGENLKSIEADASDAIAVDAQGNTYVASHSFADIELRKYTPNGSIVYDSLFRSCGEGFLSVAGLAIDNAGRTWIAGNTTACLPTTPDAFQGHVAGENRMHGFVMLVDTAKPGSAPKFLTYLSSVDSRIAAIRADNEGNAFVTGTTTSVDFPHDSILSVKDGAARAPATTLGFVSGLNPAGSGLLWSALLRNTRLTALALDGAGNVYITGRVASGQSRSDVLVAELSDRGRRLSYVATLGGSADEEGRAISVTEQGPWILVSGDTESPDFPVSSAVNKSRRVGMQPFVIALQPCKTGILASRLLTRSDDADAPVISLTPILDAFTTAFPGLLRPRGNLASSVVSAPGCPAAAQ